MAKTRTVNLENWNPKFTSHLQDAEYFLDDHGCLNFVGWQDQARFGDQVFVFFPDPDGEGFNLISQRNGLVLVLPREAFLFQVRNSVSGRRYTCQKMCWVS